MDSSKKKPIPPIVQSLLSRTLQILVYTAVVVKGTYTHMGPWAAIIALIVLELALIPYFGNIDTRLAHATWKFITSCFLLAPRLCDPARALQPGCWNELCTVFHVGVFIYAAWDLAMLFEVEQRQDECGREKLMLTSNVDLEVVIPFPETMSLWNH
ncbi:Multicopper oxidase abr1 [Venturia nashicola]|uniref:Multicopper oxidase abr1 n=1 Tax=Venturia nashicola TaxID=86259 RepID=A0A4Z1P267_9PEZI|nr:Multicopper oxidase abr1 [Venturia nashicola]TLD27607.1 Multicopper oxidase abr1 [Venturia nashicola]